MKSNQKVPTMTGTTRPSTFRQHSSKKRVTFDFETRSRADLKKVGAYKYSLDPSTQPTCLAVKVHGDKVVLFDFYQINLCWEDQSPETRNWWKHLIRDGYLFSAHNAFFEKCIYTNIMVARLGWPHIPAQQYRCTAAKAAACALPRSLEGAGSAMKLRIQKDKRGYVAMMATCKPTRAWKKWNDIHEKIRNGVRVTKKTYMKAIHDPEPKLFLEPKDAPEVWKTLYTYCAIDAETEELLDDTLPDLPKSEQEIWFLNQKLNWRGLRIDIPTVEKIVNIMAIENTKKLKDLDSLTMGLVTKPGARRSIFEFLELEGVKLPNLQAKTVDDRLKGFDLPPDMRELLEIRKALSMASTKKYQSFLNRANKDGRVRDILLYHGASTGRDTGTGIQPHNFPRGIIKVSKDRPYAHVDNAVECDVDTLKMLYGDSLAMFFSSILRNMIIPSDGYELFVADFSKIEVAVLWWLAGNLPGLKILRDGKSPYIYMAAVNTKKRYEEVPEDGNDYQLGKMQVLGCGFGMGPDRFKGVAWDFARLKLTDAQSKLAVLNYREANPTVPQLWKDYEKAAVTAVEGSPTSAARCEFYMERKFLVVKLPSGRCLRYREPQIAWRESDYGPRKSLEFWGVNPKTRKWALERTWGGTLTENIVQGTARDLMMPAMLRLDAAEYRPLLMVHDEGLCERKIGRGSVEEFVRILCQVPTWGGGLPIDAKGWNGPRYRK